MKVYGFNPIAAPDARILILGTLPGQKSLDAGQYYAHSQNAFWFIMERLFAQDASLDYEARKALLVGAKVALWDVLHAAERPGSVDSNIVPGSEVANDFATFFARHSSIHTIFFNGGNAESLFRRLVNPQPNLRLVRLTSTSPANARLTRERKLEEWRGALLAALDDNPQFRLTPMTEEHARQILSWRYEPPYDFYNPPADEAELAATFLNPDYHYYAVLDPKGALIGYHCFGADARVPGGDYSVDALDMGGGLRPDLTGRDLGPRIMHAAMALAQEVFAPRAFRATVAAWNTRALGACKKVGYQPKSTFESPAGVRFVILVCTAAAGSVTEEMGGCIPG